MLWRSFFFIAALGGCTTAAQVQVIDLDQVLEVWDEVSQMSSTIQVEAVPSELAPNVDENTRALSEMLTSFETKLNERRLIKGHIGARMKEDGAVQGFHDRNSDGDKDVGEEELFTVQIDPERSRVIASSTVHDDTYHRDRYYRRPHVGMGGLLLYSWMWGRQSRYYSNPRRTRPGFGAMSMAPQGYHKSAVTKAASRASSRRGSFSRSSRSVRSRGGSRSFSSGK